LNFIFVHFMKLKTENKKRKLLDIIFVFDVKTHNKHIL